MTRLRRRIVPCAMVTAAMVSLGVSTGATATGARHRAAAAAGCSGVAGPRIPANPLGLATAPGSDPLNGASFFVDGPKHGAAAGAIAQLLGIDTSVPVGQPLPSFSDRESWQAFLSTTVARKLPTEPASVQRDVTLLEKIAREPEPMRVSAGLIGKPPSFISSFVHKLLCVNRIADPGSVPLIGTYFMHSALGGCSSTAQINGYMPLFKSRVDAMVQAIGSRAVVLLLELDAIGSSSCMARAGSLPAWGAMLRYEVDAAATLPHAVVYVEGGYSDSNNPTYAARVLNAVDISRIRGFYTNDTHLNWTTSEVRYGNTVSRLTHGAHFVINTAQNGRGPLLNAHPATQGIEDLCNPPGRGLGPQPTTKTPFRNVDALMWATIPGNSSGCGGGPPGGTFWPSRAISLAALANQKLGPGYPSRPY